MDASKGPSEDVKNVDGHTARDLVSKGYRYLDVRTKEEFEEGHVEGALNIPYMIPAGEGRVKNPNFIFQVSEMCKKTDHMVVACRYGARSLGATTDLHNQGFENVNNIIGGYAAWLDAGDNAQAQKLASEHP